MKDTFKTYPQDGSWMSAYRWKQRIVKELRKQLTEKDQVKGQPVRATVYSVKKYWIEAILGEKEAS